MRASKKTIAVAGIVFAISILLICLYLLPVSNAVYKKVSIYKTHVAYRDNYKLHTTPLSKSVVDDLCFNLNLEDSNESCQLGAVVYAPDLFDEIKAHFNEIPDEGKTYKAVQDVLATYLILCDVPDTDGNYVCKYDLRGDSIYPIAFFFNKKGFYYRIIANIGGS